jgi:hypothetical protein
MSEQWKLTGTYFESCNCDVACPCTFLSAPTKGECSVVVGWHIDKGHFEQVNLDGLNVALVAYAPGHMLEVKWRAAVYIDEIASQEQKEALTRIYTGQAGGLPGMLATFVGEMLGVKSVPITFESNNKQRRLKIADMAEVEIEGIQDSSGADVSINNPPLGVAPGYALNVAKSKSVNYKDYDLQWELSGTNGFYSPFTYQAD